MSFRSPLPTLTLVAALPAAALASALLPADRSAAGPPPAHPLAVGADPCTCTARLQAESESFETREELHGMRAVCENFLDPAERQDCLVETLEAYLESLEEVGERYAARLDLCAKLGGGAYDPPIDPADFSTVIDNPYLPFPVGAEWTYESETEEGTETIVVTVLDETREILGVECVAVQDTVSIDGELLEDTTDWYAQDLVGNVWYFGEISFSYEDGYVVDIEGSWLAGVDGAKPGIVMLASPTPGTTYRQEWLLGEAEDAATVLATDETVSIGFGTFNGCVLTEDFLPPEPGELENKYYAPGVGFVLETKPGSTETVELVAVSGL